MLSSVLIILIAGKKDSTDCLRLDQRIEKRQIFCTQDALAGQLSSPNKLTYQQTKLICLCRKLYDRIGPMEVSRTKQMCCMQQSRLKLELQWRLQADPGSGALTTLQSSTLLKSARWGS